MVPENSSPDHGSSPRILLEHHEESAYWTLTRSQKIAAVGIGLAIVAALLWRPVATLTVINGALILFYLVHAAYKFYLVWLSLDRPMIIEVDQAEIAALRDEDLPRYTVLVPLYREARVLAELTKSLLSLDYPTDRLEVILLLEPDDTQTRRAKNTVTSGNLACPPAAAWSGCGVRRTGLAMR